MVSKSVFKLKSPLIDRLRRELRLDHKSFRTEKTYIFYVVEFIAWSNYKHPNEMGALEVSAFLSYLAENNYSVSTCTVALNALVYFFNRVCEKQIGELSFKKSTRPATIRDVLTREETSAILKELRGDYQLVGRLLYGTAMRLNEGLQLRIKDVDFGNSRITVRDTKSNRDRVVPLPKSIADDLKAKIKETAKLHAQDLKAGHGSVWMPHRLAEKFKGAEKELKWQYVFPSRTLCKDPRTGVVRRHHLYHTGLQSAMKRAAEKLGIQKRVSPHVFRHSAATHLLKSGRTIMEIKELLGHKDISTTMVYLHSADNGSLPSPLDSL